MSPPRAEVRSPIGGTRSWRAFAATALLLAAHLAPTDARAGEIDPVLARQLAAARSEGGAVDALFFFRSEVDGGALSRSLTAQGVARELRHYTVVQTLREHAERSQADFLLEAAELERAGAVSGITAYWIANAVVVRGSRRAIEQLASHPAIARAEPNLVPRLIEPVFVSAPVEPGADGDPIDIDPRDPTLVSGAAEGATPGIRAIGADRVWSELGITGEGTIVACMDTGVDLVHPALQGGWRGLVADPAQCWLNVLEPLSRTPIDRHGHGTHVMGTIAGRPAFGDSIGIAYDAVWIAANAISQQVPPSRVSSVILEAFQWFADPDGDPSTLADVPDVVQNSWGVEAGDAEFGICDSRWWTAIDNCEAAGVVVTFSAGNEGPLPSTIRTPADRASTELRNFSVGAVKATNEVWPYPIALFSSRGPSPCPPGTAVKPEVVAPGVEVYSAWTGSGQYRYASGTSMAGPHVAGVVALMRQAHPDIGVDEVKRILMETARPYGPGEDNTHGAGMIDAYAAVLTAAGGAGSGRVRGSVAGPEGLPVVDARIEILDLGLLWRSGDRGRFGGFLPLGTHDVRVSHPLLQSIELAGVEVRKGDPTVLDVSLADRTGPSVRRLQVENAVPSLLDSIEVEIELEDHTDVRSVRLFSRLPGRGWSDRPMSWYGDRTYRGGIGASRFGDVVELFVEARDGPGNVARHPDPVLDEPLSVEVQRAVLMDDGESDLGWTYGLVADEGLGRWHRYDPFGTEFFGAPVEPEDDHSPGGTQCFVTGKGKRNVEVDRADVDAGCVTLQSPLLDLSGLDEVTLEYWRWFAVEGSVRTGRFVVAVSSDGGERWIELENTVVPRAEWTERTFRLHEHLSPTERFLLRFVACDEGEDSLVEAAVDDIRIYGAPASRDDPGNPIDDDPPMLPGTPPRVVPNPFRTDTALRFVLDAATAVRIDLYDPSGRRVRRLFDGRLDPGERSLVWDGRDDSGTPLPSGAYFYRFRVGGEEEIGRVLKVR